MYNIDTMSISCIDNITEEYHGICSLIWIQEQIGRFRGSLFKSDTTYNVCIIIDLYTHSGTYAGGVVRGQHPPPPPLAPFFLLACLPERSGHVQGYPYPVSGGGGGVGRTQPCLRKKKVSEPPPPPPPSDFFQGWRGKHGRHKNTSLKEKNPSIRHCTHSRIIL